MKSAGLALVLVGSLVLAGCVSNSSSVSTSKLPAAPALPKAPTAGTFHVSPDALLASDRLPMVQALGGQYNMKVNSTEPTIATTKSGAVFMTATVPNPNLQVTPAVPFVGVRNHPTIMRTSDKGQTYSDVGPTLPTGEGQHFRTNDPIVYVDRATNRIFMDDILPLTCGVLSWSDDDGATWLTNPYACGNSQNNDHQTLVAAKPRMLTTVGYPNIVYRCVNDIAYAACSTSLTGGLTFSPQVPVFFTKDCLGSLTGHLEADHEGRVFLPRASCDQAPSLDNGENIVFMTEDDGLTWTRILVDKEHIAKSGDPNAHEMDLAVDEADNLYATWNAQGMVWLSSSTDHGKTWSPARNVVAPGVTATMFSAIDAKGVGNVAFTYIGTTIPDGYDGKPDGIGGLVGDVVGEPDPPEWADANWNGYIGLMTNALDPMAPIQTVTANDPSDPLARGLCGQTRCHGMNDFIDVKIDSEGRPWGAFIDVCTEKCVADPTVHFDKAKGFMGSLVEGPSLLGKGEALTPIAAPPPPKPAS